MEQSMSYFNIPVIFFSIASLAVSMEYLNLDTEASASFGSNNASINRKTTSNGCHFVRDGSLIDEIVRPANLQQTVDWLKKVRREIHEYPEVAHEELQTSELIRRELDLMGVKHRWPIAGTGVVATIGTGLPAFVALGADMDALPILGTVVLIFQPAEERGVGAVQRIEGGALKDVESIFSMHVYHAYPTGVIASRPGEFLAGCGIFKAYISGKGGRVAASQDSVDPISAASASIITLQNLISREADPLDSQGCLLSA
ncbi:putative IAA-amino acid hydrolase ILR1-like 1 [Cocos nucifera]|uniref:Putative IAA-amino acid hydrolase ILR1-like 1 n=1 Tax=Cocos nucifera TaxID=13894 RepID=A0A8K0N9R4_COCNU|nr:putative IAA-amino acid hydrolase ILR1-like 1 [Cocos nucifera]